MDTRERERVAPRIRASPSTHSDTFERERQRDPEPGAIEEDDDQPDVAGHVLQNPADLVAAEHDRRARRHTRSRDREE